MTREEEIKMQTGVEGLAAMQRAYYTALLSAGFPRKEAFELLKLMIVKNWGQK